MTRALRQLGALLGAALLLILHSSATTPPPEGMELDRAVPGAHERELRAAFGEPLAREAHRVEFSLPAAGYERVTVWLDGDELVTCARVRPVRPLRLAAAELLFDLRGPSARAAGHAFSGVAEGLSQSHPQEGVHFFVVGERVEEIWRTAPDADPGELGGELGVAYPPVALPAPDPQPEPEPDPLVPPDAEPPNLLLRGLTIGSLDVALELDDDFNPVLVATAQVGADGMSGKEIQFEAYLRPLELGGPTPARLAAARDAPAALRAGDGSLHATGSATVLYDSANFGAVDLRLPLARLADFHANFGGRFLVTFEAICDGLGAVEAVATSLPDVSDDAVVALPELTVGAPLVAPDEHESFGPGLWVFRDVHALHLRDETVWSVASLRLPSGAAVQAAEGWDSWRTAEGGFYAAGTDTVLYDDSSWEPFRVFVPFAGLALEPGVHRLVLRSQVNMSHLGGADELELDVTIPEPTR